MNWLEQAKTMQEQKEAMTNKFAEMPVYGVDEPEIPKEEVKINVDGGGEKTTEPQSTSSNPEGDTPLSSEGKKLNKLSAEKFIKGYNTLINQLSIHGYEWKNGDLEIELKAHREQLREYLNQNSSLSAIEQNTIRTKIDTYTQQIEKLNDRRKYLDENTRLSTDDIDEAAQLLSEIWKVKNIEVSPWWGLAIILCAPVVNAVLIIFADGKRFKVS